MVRFGNSVLVKKKKRTSSTKRGSKGRRRERRRTLAKIGSDAGEDGEAAVTARMGRRQC